MADSFQILGYPLATVIAEKLSTAVSLGDLNTRDRDYGDLCRLLNLNDLDGQELTTALTATASHRGIIRPRHGHPEGARRPWKSPKRQLLGPNTYGPPPQLEALSFDAEMQAHAQRFRPGGFLHSGHRPPGRKGALIVGLSGWHSPAAPSASVTHGRPGPICTIAARLAARWPSHRTRRALADRQHRAKGQFTAL
ncbi:nucleotidyl transferase AbiEii/AbiGii toxin family protein [Streptomyces sp. NPDC005574]|uniref:nucleotidyl transferase AbiEii/AbiGii toxin family protein n=1 Tax=Streptomyces sp. NPDC005574 TaxID=3156891 RepID=UPI0033BCE94E